MKESITFFLFIILVFAVVWLYAAALKDPGLLQAGVSLPSWENLRELEAPNVGKNFRESNVLRHLEDLPLR